MPTLDMKKTLRHLYQPSAKTVSVVDVPSLPYLMIDGTGNPNTAQRYREAVAALYKMAYGVRALRKAAGSPFTVMPLEGLWRFAGQTARDPAPLRTADKDQFEWTLMIVLPKQVTAGLVEEARAVVHQKSAPPILDDVRYEQFHEGEAVQIMHIGPYDNEAPTIARLHTHIMAQGWTLRGNHHEIYLSDPRRIAPEKLKTVIRQPFQR